MTKWLLMRGIGYLTFYYPYNILGTCQKKKKKDEVILGDMYQGEKTII